MRDPCLPILNSVGGRNTDYRSRPRVLNFLGLQKSWRTENFRCRPFAQMCLGFKNLLIVSTCTCMQTTQWFEHAVFLSFGSLQSLEPPGKALSEHKHWEHFSVTNTGGNIFVTRALWGRRLRDTSAWEHIVAKPVLRIYISHAGSESKCYLRCNLYCRLDVAWRWWKFLPARNTRFRKPSFAGG